jgi:type II secretory pathway pseudopilin PulG
MFKLIYQQKKKGGALVAVLVMVVIVAIILSSLLVYITSQLKFSEDRVERERAFQIAEAGAYYYRWYLAHVIEGRTAAQIENFWQNENPTGVSAPYIAEFKDPAGVAIGQYQLEVTAPVAGSTIVTVISTGWTYQKPTVHRIVQVRFRRPSWSEFVFLSNSFMNFGDQATVYGKVHSNDGIRFDGKAYNVISSGKSRFDDATYGGIRMEFGVHTTVNPADGAAPPYPWAAGTVPLRPDVFVGGRQFPVPEVSFTGVTTDLSNMKAQAQSSGKYFDATGMGRRINLKSDGTFDVCTVNTANSITHAITKYNGIVTGATGAYSGTNGSVCSASTCCTGTACAYVQPSKSASGRCISLSNYPLVSDRVIFVEDNIWVEGAVNNKRLTIVAANLAGGTNKADIYIGISNQNLRLSDYTCANTLGLIAQRDIRILNDCPSNFTIDAALLAQEGTVGIVSGMGGKYALVFNGAIASYLQPYFQSGASGFANRTYNFNNNLLYCPPAYFPTGTEYLIDLWDEGSVAL